MDEREDRRCVTDFDEDAFVFCLVVPDKKLEASSHGAGLVFFWYFTPVQALPSRRRR